MSSIDKCDWHCWWDYPTGIADENGGTHIGMYLNWIIDAALISDYHLENSLKELHQVQNQEINWRDFLFNICDGKFGEFDLNQRGIDFTKFYYNDSYYKDYFKVLWDSQTKSLYHIENTWDNYNKIRSTINIKFYLWKLISIKIGLYLQWAVDNDLIWDKYLKKTCQELEQLKNREINGETFINKMCNWADLNPDEDLNKEWAEFFKFYHVSSMKYHDDFKKILWNNSMKHLCNIEGTWDEYDKLKKTIDKRFKNWKKKSEKKKWEFWK